MTEPATSLDNLPLAASAHRALMRFADLTGIASSQLSGAGLLYERALMLGLTPNANASPNGSCHLIPCRDAMLAVNLPRSTDWELVPAWLGPWQENIEVAADDWTTLRKCCLPITAEALLTQAHVLGLAVARCDNVPAAPLQPFTTKHFTPESTSASQARNAPLVVDLSSLWAGPLCSHLLQQAGCRVIKVEGTRRHDGARIGSPDFYQLLNQGKESITLDFQSADDIQRLKQLISYADIVIEGSRPRALRNLGILAEQQVRLRPGKIWISITGYGRQNQEGDRIGFGDDAAAAAGLSHIMHEATGTYQIVGDAIADPLTGIHAALNAWESYRTGGNDLIAISLCDTVSFCLGQELNSNREQVLASCRLWQQQGHQLNRLFTHGPRKANAECASPGQHNAAIFAELDLFAGTFHQQHCP